MLRTCLFAAFVGLTGCIVVRDPPPPPPAPARRAPPARPAAQPAATTAAAPASTVPRLRLGGASVAAATGAAGTKDVTPAITSPIAFGNGTGGAFRGLAYVVPENTTAIPNLSDLVPFATLYTDSFQIRPQPFSGGFPGALAQDSWFAIRYEGNFAVQRDATYLFRLASDDGAVLYVDGQKVVDNDGQHTVKVAQGQKELKTGSHRLRLEYFQAQKGDVALVLSMNEGGQERPVVGTK
jgi:hypothetical protein